MVMRIFDLISELSCVRADSIAAIGKNDPGGQGREDDRNRAQKEDRRILSAPGQFSA